ncbi:MAG: hypothetical protein V7700_06560 [Halioglobus sp.]
MSVKPPDSTRENAGLTIAKYPHNKLGKGKPYEGIENLRPESIETVETFM